MLFLQFYQNGELEVVMKYHFYVKIKKILYHPLLLILTSLVSSNKISKINFWDNLLSSWSMKVKSILGFNYW